MKIMEFWSHKTKIEVPNEGVEKILKENFGVQLIYKTKFGRKKNQIIRFYEEKKFMIVVQI